VEPENNYSLEAIDKQIKNIVVAAEELKRLSSGVPAIDKNAEAILTFAHILENDVSDILELDEERR